MNKTEFIEDCGFIRISEIGLGIFKDLIEMDNYFKVYFINIINCINKNYNFKIFKIKWSEDSNCGYEICIYLNCEPKLSIIVTERDRNSSYIQYDCDYYRYTIDKYMQYLEGFIGKISINNNIVAIGNIDSKLKRLITSDPDNRLIEKIELYYR